MAITPGNTVGAVPPTTTAGLTKEERKVIAASSLGTVFEWYDFYLYGSLATIIAKQFFIGDPNTTFIFALLAFAAGFIVRPFGALVFGRLGDMIGRKYTFLITILLMGASTFLVGILPSYAQIGIAAPIILVTLRILQGLALGGEYGGAATYVAEHAPHGKRGLLHGVHPDHGDDRPVPVAAGHSRHPHADRRRRIPGLGLAHSVPDLGRAAGDFGLDPAVDERVAGICQDEGGRQDVESAAVGSVPETEERQDRPAGAARPDDGPGRGLVHGPVLRAVLPDQDAQDCRPDGQHPDRRSPCCWPRRSSSSSARCRTRSAASGSSWAAARLRRRPTSRSSRPSRTTAIRHWKRRCAPRPCSSWPIRPPAASRSTQRAPASSRHRATSPRAC